MSDKTNDFLRDSLEIKVYCIDRQFYEIRELSSFQDVVDQITTYHKNSTTNKYDINPKIIPYEFKGAQYLLYSFNEVEKISPWKDYFPEELSEGVDFAVKSTSFGLFTERSGYIFAIIGNKGLSVIKRYIDRGFGINFFEKFCDPAEDDVLHVQARVVVGNINTEELAYAANSKLRDAIGIGRVPLSMTILMRNEIKDSIFDFLEFKKRENIQMSVSSGFVIKRQISFHGTHMLFDKIADILSMKDDHKHISRFEKIYDRIFIESTLQNKVYSEIFDDATREINPYGSSFSRLDYDFCHPSKLSKYYDCDAYSAYMKGESSPFVTVTDRTEIYRTVLHYVRSLPEISDLSSFVHVMMGVRIRGFKRQVKMTEAMFINHINCEIDLMGLAYFFISDSWYKVRGELLDELNEKCTTILKANYLEEGILHFKWEKTETERQYNLKYQTSKNYFVLDGILSEGIELCDIIYEDEETVYFIHVKKGFDNKIRDLSNQIDISSQLFWNDKRSGCNFIKRTLEKAKEDGRISDDTIIEDLVSRLVHKNAVFVMAFSGVSKYGPIKDNLNRYTSNIAKFTIVNAARSGFGVNSPLMYFEILT